ncbi:unnamed protein product [Citrullus colocynthis]|uniref:Uncharacterized protein n=1 Tax=Citrullus colocynthis TaxID=252529 RepID=A0ABP0YGS4_9ROSI
MIHRTILRQLLISSHLTKIDSVTTLCDESIFRRRFDFTFQSHLFFFPGSARVSAFLPPRADCRSNATVHLTSTAPLHSLPSPVASHIRLLSSIRRRHRIVFLERLEVIFESNHTRSGYPKITNLTQTSDNSAGAGGNDARTGGKVVETNTHQTEIDADSDGWLWCDRWRTAEEDKAAGVDEAQ